MVQANFIHQVYSKLKNIILGAAPVVQRFGAACSLGCDPEVPGLSPASGSLHGAYFCLCLSVCVCVCVCMCVCVCVSHE